MKKYTPYIFPLIVICIVFFLVYRWYALRTQRDNGDLQYGNTIQIEEVNPAELKNVVIGGKDVTSTKLQPTDPSAQAAPAMGTIRYEVLGDKLNFSVSADLPESAAAYRVWVRSKDGDDLTEAFKLEAGKGGFMGSASVPKDVLPLEVIVSTATQKAEVLNMAVLKGVIEQITAK